MTTATGMVAVALAGMLLTLLVTARRRPAPPSSPPTPPQKASAPEERPPPRAPDPRAAPSGRSHPATPPAETRRPEPTRPEAAPFEVASFEIMPFEPVQAEATLADQERTEEPLPFEARADEYPESMTAVLEPEDEEYLAWLADHHWPADEYLDLEQLWLHEIDPFGHPDPADTPQCPQCLLRLEDVWPCHQCGRLLHSSCGHGMRRREVEHPYRSHAAGFEAVIAEWVCTGCTSVVGLDVSDDDPHH